MEQDNTELQARVARLLAKPCASGGCDNAATQVRLNTSPAWGFDPGSNEQKVSSEYGFLLGVEDEITAPGCYDTGIDLAKVAAYCNDHFPTRTSKRETARRAGPRESAHQRTLRLREKALRAYGEQCVDCGLDDRVRLALCLKDEVIDGSGEPVWAELGVRNWAHKWEVLETLGYPPICVIRCLGCRHKNSVAREGLPPRQQYARTTDPKPGESRRTKAAYRDRAIAAYGGSCEICGEDRVSHLWLVRKAGAAVLRWGENGRKMTSKQRYKWLLEHGCPDTHRLLCQPCWKQTRIGQGGDYL